MTLPAVPQMNQSRRILDSFGIVDSLKRHIVTALSLHLQRDRAEKPEKTAEPVQFVFFSPMTVPVGPSVKSGIFSAM
jgi:hypothetical protein